MLVYGGARQARGRAAVQQIAEAGTLDTVSIIHGSLPTVVVGALARPVVSAHFGPRAIARANGSKAANTLCRYLYKAYGVRVAVSSTLVRRKAAGFSRASAARPGCC
jgi:hypothetical protein